MRELTIVRTVRPGLWVADDDGRCVLVREIPPERAETYRAAAALPLPIPTMVYVGPDAEGDRHVVVEEVLGHESADAEGSQWRSLAALAPVFRDSTDRLVLGLIRAAEAVAWLHAAGFVHGYITPQTLYLHPSGGVCLAGLDCLQRAGDERLPCIAYSPAYICKEQFEGWVGQVTDVRLLALALAEAYLGQHPLEGPVRPTPDRSALLAGRPVRLPGDRLLSRLLERMGAVDPQDRPRLGDILRELRRVWRS